MTGGHLHEDSTSRVQQNAQTAHNRNRTHVNHGKTILSREGENGRVLSLLSRVRRPVAGILCNYQPDCIKADDVPSMTMKTAQTLFRANMFQAGKAWN